MKTWSFDILWQAPWDWWDIVCIAASLVLLCYAGFGKLWTRGPRGIVALVLIITGVGGTALILGVPPLHTVSNGLWWTFILLCLLSATFYLELIERLGIGRSMMLLFLRVLALAVGVPMLFGPVLRYVSRHRPERPLMILVDTSGSMSFPDVQNGPTRIQSVWQTIAPQLDKIDAHFVPHYFTFDTGFKKLKNAKDLSKLQADGKSTDIARGINKTMAQVTRDDAAIVIFTDGIDNTSPDVVEAVKNARVPVHTLRVGSEQTESSNLVNIAVADVEASEDFVVNHETTVKATIKSTALPNRVVDVKMAEVDDKGKQTGPMVSQKLILQPTAEGQQVSLPYKPTSVGVRRIAVWVDPVPGERSVVDNRQEFQGLAIDPNIKVLYIEGRARLEYKFLNKLFAADPNVEWSTYLQVTPRSKADIHGTVDGAPFTGLPTTAEGWRKLDVIIIGDVPATFFPKAQQQQIEQAVLNGSALLMIGGENTLGPGGYQGTPMEKALPVLVGPASMPQEKTEFIPRLTAEGAVHPAMEGLADYFGTEDKPGVKIIPPLRGNVVVAGPKTGAQVLLVHKDKTAPDGKPEILLAVQRYGKGRSAVFTGDTTYLWTLEMYGKGQDSPYNKLWAQLIRWLAGTDVRNRQKGAGVEGLLNKTVYQLGENVRIRAMVRDDHGDATHFAQVTLKLKQAGSKDGQSFTLNPVENHNGMYDLTIPHPEKGEWTGELSAMKDSKPLGKQELKFTVIPPADEMLKLAANPKLLASIADATNGTHRDLAGFPQLLDELIRADKTPAEQEKSVNLSNFPRIFLGAIGHEPNWDKKTDLPIQGGLMIAILAVEWILRRRWQLP
ncbi:MAG TPA: glutamine amidotransferase [Tepidisphaeraceae bacterium]|nr:glutamine amidotransferase [Tepidisphaeraceae bacterium]